MNDSIIINNKLNTIDLYSDYDYEESISTIHNDNAYYMSKEIEFYYLIYKQPFINNIFPKITQNEFKECKYFTILKNKYLKNKKSCKKLCNDKQNCRRRELYKINKK